MNQASRTMPSWPAQDYSPLNDRVTKQKKHYKICHSDALVMGLQYWDLYKVGLNGRESPHGIFPGYNPQCIRVLERERIALTSSTFQSKSRTFFMGKCGACPLQNLITMVKSRRANGSSLCTGKPGMGEDQKPKKFKTKIICLAPKCSLMNVSSVRGLCIWFAYGSRVFGSAVLNGSIPSLLVKGRTNFWLTQ